jgi:uncharacterized YccA/Bax inhibitor family protein
MRTSNPALNESTFRTLERVEGSSTMTVSGAIDKSFILIGLALLTAGVNWYLFFQGSALVMPLTIGGAIGGLIVALITAFKKTASPITAPIYALLEGLLLGGISAIMESQLPGITIQAVGLTFGVFIIMLMLYKYKIVVVTEKLRSGIFAATGAVALVYLISFGLSFFGMSVPYIHQGGTIGILFSLVVVGIAAFNLVLDFDFFDKGEQAQAPKYMEWYAAFGLLVTLVWLYIEILRLLSKLRSK